MRETIIATEPIKMFFACAQMKLNEMNSTTQFLLI